MSFPNLTAIYCSLLAIWLFVLSIRVIGLRGNPAFAFIAQGKGDEELLNRAIRAQANLIEYAPIMLFILFFLRPYQKHSFSFLGLRFHVFFSLAFRIFLAVSQGSSSFCIKIFVVPCNCLNHFFCLFAYFHVSDFTWSTLSDNFCSHLRYDITSLYHKA